MGSLEPKWAWAGVVPGLSAQRVPWQDCEKRQFKLAFLGLSTERAAWQSGCRQGGVESEGSGAHCEGGTLVGCLWPQGAMDSRCPRKSCRTEVTEAWSPLGCFVPVLAVLGL